MHLPYIPMSKRKKSSRSPKFIPKVIEHLKVHTSFQCKFKELPKSYQAQPHNVAAKIEERGKLKVRVIFSVANNIFTILKTTCN